MPFVNSIKENTIMKKTLCVILTLLMVLALASCAGTGSSDTTTTTAFTAKTTVNIAVLKGPTGMGAAFLMKQNESGAAANKYTFKIESAPDAISSALTSGSLDLAAVPSNLAAMLKTKGAADIKVIAVNTLGVLYVLEKGDTVKKIADLDGKKVIASGKGTTAEAVISKLLGDSGAEITYAAEHAEAVTQAASGAYDVCILPEPFVTSLIQKKSEFKIALDLTKEWKDAGLGELPMGVVVARAAFITEHPDAVKSFLVEYKASVDYVNKNIDEASALIGQYGIMPAAVAKAAIPNANMVCVTGNDMTTQLTAFYAALYDFNAALIGGKIPADDLYYTK